MARKGSNHEAIDFSHLDEDNLRSKTKTQLIDALMRVSQKKDTISNANDVILNQMNEKLDLLLEDNKILQKRITSLEKIAMKQSAQIENLERINRRPNIIIHGLDEQKDVKSVFTEICDAIDVNLDWETDVSDFTRLGKKVMNKARPVRLVMARFTKKSEILQKSKNLRDTEYDRFFISSDLTPYQQMENKRLRDRKREEMNNPKNRGKRVFISKGSLYVDDVVIDSFQKNMMNFL